MLLGGIRLKACEIVEEAHCLRVESPGRGGDNRHEPVVLSQKPLVVLGHLGEALWSAFSSQAYSVPLLPTGCTTVKSSVRPAVPMMLVGYSNGP